MKKLAILFVAIASMTLTAAAQCPNATPCQQTQCEGPRGPQDKMYRPTNKMDKAMEGILLTPEQQKQVDALKAECKAKKDSCKQSRQQCKRQAKKDRLNKMKAILTPEQYTMFLENIVISDGANGPRMKMGRKADMRGPKCGKAMAQRPDGMKGCPKADCKKADCKKDCPKADCKKADCKKADKKDGKKSDKKAK